MRIAWIGTPSVGGGVGGICRLFLRELARMPLELDVYANNQIGDVPELQGAFEGRKTRFLPFPYSWDWDAWYGRNRRTAFVANFLKRLPLHGRLVKALIAEHRRDRYDVVVQFSQGELFSLGKYLDEVPVILFPCVHAAGECYWCRREEQLARQCESWWWRTVRNLYLAYRARLQRRDYRRVRGVIGLSNRFNAWVERDYGVPPAKLGVVYHPIECNATATHPSTLLPAIRLLFVGRVSVRKGIDLLVQAIPIVLAGHPEVEVTIVGAGSLWSDYEALLRDLPHERCRWLKSLPNKQVTEEMRRSDILLVPSLYEPGGIVVGEALANGMVVVASDEVGSAENLLPPVCQEFRAGEVAGFLDAIERAVTEVHARGPALRMAAISAAREHFDPGKMAALLVREVTRLLRSAPSDAEPNPAF